MILEDYPSTGEYSRKLEAEKRQEVIEKANKMAKDVVDRATLSHQELLEQKVSGSKVIKEYELISDTDVLGRNQSSERIKSKLIVGSEVNLDGKLKEASLEKESKRIFPFKYEKKTKLKVREKSILDPLKSEKFKDKSSDALAESELSIDKGGFFPLTEAKETLNHGTTSVTREVELSPDTGKIEVKQTTTRPGEYPITRVWATSPEKHHTSDGVSRIAGAVLERSAKPNEYRRLKRAEQIAKAKEKSEELKKDGVVMRQTREKRYKHDNSKFRSMFDTDTSVH